MESETYRELDRQWRATCRAVLGGGIGPLDEYSGWLSGLNDPLVTRKSSFSGMPVAMTSENYCRGARILDLSEADFMKKFEPLSINDIKDIDSLLSAVRERAAYCGNIAIGNSKFIQGSSEVSDSFYVYNSVRVSGCKNVAYSQWMRLSENIFGTNEGGESSFCIRCGIVYRNSRGFELWICGNTSDSHYSYGLEDCRDCMFCFNLIGKSCHVGNLPLARDTYAGLKKKLLAEMRQELAKNKRLPSLIELVGAGRESHSPAMAAIKGLSYSPRDSDKSKLEEAFSEASSVVLGERLSGIDNYARWLSNHTIVTRDSKSVLSGRTLQVSDYPVMKELPASRLVTQEEALVLGEKLQSPQKLAEAPSLSNADGILSPIAYFPPERRLGTYKNLVACQWGSGSTDCYRTCVASHDKFCGYNAWPRNSEHIFGSGLVFHSEFCFKCFDGVQLKRCFELDSCRGCSDTWFSHNAEGMQNAIFCFNTKSKRYAVGNAEVGKEQFQKAKGMVQGYVLSELSKKKGCRLSIFNIGCQAGRE